MLAKHLLSPALSIEEAGLMTYPGTPPDAGPSVTSDYRFAELGVCRKTIGSDWWKATIIESTTPIIITQPTRR